MSTYHATVSWSDSGPDFKANKYSRRHEWRFDGGVTVPASASPHIVPAPWSAPEAVDPEEAFVASLSSCHMLFFLSLAGRQGFHVTSYQDDASGVLEKNDQGKTVMTTVTLNPRCSFGGDKIPDQAAIEKLHHHAHELCFIANSVTTRIIINPGSA